jgi:predicted  nucleic acid-binding Zn-ribbon protein
MSSSVLTRTEDHYAVATNTLPQQFSPENIDQTFRTASAAVAQVTGQSTPSIQQIYAPSDNRQYHYHDHALQGQVQHYQQKQEEYNIEAQKWAKEKADLENEIKALKSENATLKSSLADETGKRKEYHEGWVYSYNGWVSSYNDCRQRHA